MFDIKKAFKALEGKTYSGGDFWDLVKRMRAENLKDIPAELELNDLIIFARQRNWLQEDASGNVTVVIS